MPTFWQLDRISNYEHANLTIEILIQWINCFHITTNFICHFISYIRFWKKYSQNKSFKCLFCLKIYSLYLRKAFEVRSQGTFSEIPPCCNNLKLTDFMGSKYWPSLCFIRNFHFNFYIEQFFINLLVLNELNHHRFLNWPKGYKKR